MQSLASTLRDNCRRGMPLCPNSRTKAACPLRMPCQILAHVNSTAAEGDEGMCAYLVGIDGFNELVAQLEDWQALALLLDGPHIVETEGGRLAQRLGLPLRHLIAAQPNTTELLCE